MKIAESAAVMSSTSGGQPSFGTKMDLAGTPNQQTKKRKADLLSPPLRDDTPKSQKSLNEQIKLKTLMEKVIAEVNVLWSTLGPKAKIETRGYAESLYLMMETIKADNLLDSLGTAQENQSAEFSTEHGEIMDTSNNGPPNREVMCSRCKKEVLDEKQITEDIRSFVEETHLADYDQISATEIAMLNKKWPQESYTKSTVKIGNPLQEVSGDVLLAIKSKNDNPYILSKFEERHAGLKDLIKEELEDGQIQFLENTTKTKSGVRKCHGRVYVMSGESIQDHYTALKELGNEMKEPICRKISIVAANETIRTSIRKLVEIVFFQTEVEIDVYVPKKENRGQAQENKYDTIVVNSSVEGRTYSDMLRTVRENIDPENLGINIKSMRKRKDDSILIVTEKNHVDALKKEITENCNMKDIHIVDKKCDLLITGMDAITTKEEILKAIEVSGSLTEDDINKLEIKNIYANRSGEQVATISTVKEIADKVIPTGHLRIGWSRCRIKEKVSIPRCSNCLRVGHVNRSCKTKATGNKKCLNCTQAGHEAKDCTNTSHCNSCSKSGHRADSMSCPMYRKKVYEKERSMAQ